LTIKSFIFLLLLLTMVFYMPVSHSDRYDLEIYSDGVVLSINHTEDYKGGVNAYIILDLDVNRNYFNIDLKGNISIPTNTSFNAYANGSLITINKNDSFNSSFVNQLHIEYNDSYLIVNTSVLFNVEKISYNGELKGIIYVSGNSSLTEQLMSILTSLNKSVVEQYINTSNIRGVNVRDWIVSSGEDNTTLYFYIALDFKSLNQSLNNVFANTSSNISIDLLKLIENAPSMSLTYSFNASINNSIRFNMNLKVLGDINEALDKLSTTLATQSNTLSLGYPISKTIGLPSGLLNSLSTVLKQITQTFEIKPSKGRVLITADADRDVLNISIQTPRFIKRNGTLQDTLIEIYKIGLIMASTGKFNLSDTVLRIVLIDSGLEVLKDDNSVSEIGFNDLPYVKITLKQTVESTTQESPENISSIEKSIEEQQYVLSIILIVLSIVIVLSIILLIKARK